MLTRLIYHIAFKKRAQALARYAHEARALQEEQLRWLVLKAKDTAFGRHYDLANGGFSNIPLQTYDEQKPWIERMLGGESNVLWPGLCKWFAKSSGTTSDKSKFIPITEDALKLTHYRGGTDCVVIYLTLNPDSQMFSGHSLILGGSFDSNTKVADGLHVGDLSATLIKRVNPLVNLVRVPSQEVALMPEWEAKMQLLTKGCMTKDVTNLSGVPSWMMGVLKNVLKETGKKDISEVWPNLEVFFHGGIAFGPYREQYRQLIPSKKMHYLETYNASEGFFGIQSTWDDDAMQLIIDNKVFYEFIPMDEFELPDPAPGEQYVKGKHRHAIPLWEVEPGVNYAMVITTPGLWRYIIGDTVKFTQRDPYKFHITGRTKAFINAFGEELMVSNADEALTWVCQQTGATVLDYTAGPTFAQGGKKGHHTWIIEFSTPPQDMEQFADMLDSKLQQVNSDYEAKRYKGIFLDRLELIPARKDLFHDWLAAKQKLGGQHKIPRLSNSRTYLEQLTEINK